MEILTMPVELFEKGIVFNAKQDDQHSYTIFHAGKRQTIVIRHSTDMNHYSTIVLPGKLTFKDFKRQYLQLSSDTFATNAFPTEESAFEFAQLLLDPDYD
jgi:hypothetical protein